MDLSIIIVSWNVQDLLRENLQAIFLHPQKSSFEVIVVDNASHDGTVAMVKSEFPQVQVVANTENRGFAAANNQGVKIAQGEYMLFLNPDMRVMPTTISDMVTWMQSHPQAGIASCKLVDNNEKIVPHVRRFPRLFDQLAIVLKISHVFPGLLNDYLQRDFDYTKTASVDSVRGSFFMVPRKIIETVGSWDEAYFVWFEEVDWCRRVKQAGYKVMYTPDVQCVDFVGKSFAQINRYKTQKIFTTSMITYFKKWHPWYQVVCLYIARPFGLLSAWLVEKAGVKKKSGVVKN